MFVDEIWQAIEAARTHGRLDDAFQAVTKASVGGTLTDEDAQTLYEAIHARRAVLEGREPGSRVRQGRPSIFPPKRPQRSPDRVASRYRRRHHARARWMPDTLADRFTDGEVAALAVVAQEHHAQGYCDLPIGKIAALAGVSETTVRNAFREARHLNLISVEERPQQGRPNLTNIVRVTSPEWRTWIERRPASWARGGGCNDLKAPLKRELLPLNPPQNGASGDPSKGYRKGGAGGGPPL